METSSSTASATAGEPKTNGPPRGGGWTASLVRPLGPGDLTKGMGEILLALPVATARRSLFRRPTLRFLTCGTVAMLAIECLLGTYLSMFVEIPASGAMQTLPLDGLVVVARIILAISLIILCARVVLVATRAKTRQSLAPSALSMIGVVLTFVGGSLISSSRQDDVMAFVRASATFIAIIAAAALLANAASAREAPASRPAWMLPPKPSTLPQ